MSGFDFVLILITVSLAGLAMLPKVRKNIWWGATVTPLASIIGSGFLVIAPLLASVVGSYALVAMLGIVVLAYGVGHIIRYNILNAEPLENSPKAPRGMKLSEALSDASLSIAYVVIPPKIVGVHK